MSIDFKDKKIKLTKGEMCVIPKGVEHRPHAVSECKVLIVEPRGVVNTGEKENDFTRDNDLWI